MKRTNVVLDEKKVEKAKKISGIATTKDLLDYALSELLRAESRKQILKLKGKLKLDLDLESLRNLR